MAVGFPTKANWAAGDVLTAAQMDDLAGTVNLFSNASAAAGSQLISNAAGTSVAYQATPSASNPVLNSAMQIWQRGTSIAIAASTVTYTADRWQIQTQANQATTVARYATSDTTNLPNIQYCSRVQRNSGQTGTSGITFAQNFESINSIPYVGKTITLSFYARAGANYSPSSSILTGGIYSGTGTDQSVITGYTGLASVMSTNAVLTTTWQRFTVSGTVGTTATELSVAFTYTPTGTALTNDYFEITGVQLDVGSVALPFRTFSQTFQGELAACQRYYYRQGGDNLSQTMGSGIGATTTIVTCNIYLPVQMRTAPTVVDYSTLNVTDVASTNTTVSSLAIATSSNSKNIASVNATVASGITTTRPYNLAAANSLSAYVGLSAEL